MRHSGRSGDGVRSGREDTRKVAALCCDTLITVSVYIIVPG